MGAPLVLIRQIWPEKGPKGPFSAEFVRFSLLTLPQKGQNRSQSVPVESKWAPKGSKLYQNALNWVPSGLKWHQHELKWVKMAPNAVQRGPKRPQGVVI